ncbi:MAG: hypothetical protein PVG66_01510 [Chromatiales bacterium]|jgi:hypothetical protein
MKKIAKCTAVLAITLMVSMNATAGGGDWYDGGDKGWSGSVPEMDAGMSAMALGLLAGVIGLVAERRRR